MLVAYQNCEKKYKYTIFLLNTNLIFDTRVLYI